MAHASIGWNERRILHAIYKMDYFGGSVTQTYNKYKFDSIMGSHSINNIFFQIYLCIKWRYVPVFTFEKLWILKHNYKNLNENINEIEHGFQTHLLMFYHYILSLKIQFLTPIWK